MAKKGNENRKQGTIWEKEAKEFLENLSNSEFQDEVTKVLQDFHS